MIHHPAHPVKGSASLQRNTEGEPILFSGEGNMIIDKKTTDTGRTQYIFRGIENKALRAMNDEQLAAELARVEDDQKRWQDQVRHQPRWFRSIPDVLAEKNCLKSEWLRVSREMKARQQIGAHGVPCAAFAGVAA
jgi:hypothetical protein